MWFLLSGRRNLFLNAYLRRRFNEESCTSAILSCTLFLTSWLQIQETLLNEHRSLSCRNIFSRLLSPASFTRSGFLLHHYSSLLNFSFLKFVCWAQFLLNTSPFTINTIIYHSCLPIGAVNHQNPNNPFKRKHSHRRLARIWYIFHVVSGGEVRVTFSCSYSIHLHSNHHMSGAWLKQRSAGRGIFPVPSRPVLSRGGTECENQKAGRDGTGRDRSEKKAGRDGKQIFSAGRDCH